MHISKLSLVNYRNFYNSKLLFDSGINTIIGENGSGKTNLFRALRLLLDNSMPRSSTKLAERDFCRALSDWRGHWIIISVEFNDIAADEASQSLFLHGIGNAEDEVVTRATYNLLFRPKSHVRQTLSQITAGDKTALDQVLGNIKIEDYETVLTGKSTANFNDPAEYARIVGDFDNIIFPENLVNSEIGISLPNILNMANEVSFTFIKALRDVVSDFHSNRTNPLLTLLKNKTGDISETEFRPIASLIQNLNTSIEGLSDIGEVRDDIFSTVSDAVGDTYSPKSMSIRSNLTDDSDQLFQSLKLFVDESNDGEEISIIEMSLGGANLLFLTLKLLEFKYHTSDLSIANYLLIEEPEAHIHTHIQKSLFNNIKYVNTQIFYSTHSTYISEVSNIRNMNVIGYVDNLCHVFQPSAGLHDSEIEFIHRYLDATRSNLLFARSVVLVEGDSEEILVPTIIKKAIGLSLDELGISLINIRSTGFKNIALLFADSRIKKRCGIITDLDKAYFDTIELETDDDPTKKKKSKARGSEKSGLERKDSLDSIFKDNPWVKTFYAEHTFEIDFIKSYNNRYFDQVVNDVYKSATTIDTAKKDLSSSDITISGTRALTMANHQGKGWFALTLSKVVDFKICIPDYIFDAIAYAHGNFNDTLKYKILEHRYGAVLEHVQQSKELIAKLEESGDKSLQRQWELYLAPYESGLTVFTPKWEAFSLARGSVAALKADLMEDLPTETNDILSRF